MRLQHFAPAVAFLAAILAVAPTAVAASRQQQRIANAIKTLEDLDVPDAKRARARALLVRAGAVDELLKLGKETADDNVRTHVAIALSELTRGRGKIAASLGLLAKWAEAEDAALHYRAIPAIANARTPEAVELLVKVLGASDDAYLTMAVARAIGSMQGRILVDKGIPILTGKLLLGHKDPKRRVAGITGLGVTARGEEDVVGPLFKVALGDAEPAVWRAAVTALRDMARTKKGKNWVPADASQTQRLKILRVWQKEWRIQKKRAAAKAPR